VPIDAVSWTVVNEKNKKTGHAFISYVREDSRRVDRLQKVLEAAGIGVWRDTGDLWPGEDWRAKIRHAISDGSIVFIGCFSHRSAARTKSYQNEELTLAVDEMRQRPAGEPWLIPVRFDDCDIPDRDIGGGRTLASIQRVDLFGGRGDEGRARLVAMVLQILGRYSSPQVHMPTPTDVLEWEDNIKEIMKLIGVSKEIWLWGAALTEHIPMLAETLRLGVSRGLQAKVLLIAPDSASVRMLAFRAVPPPSSPPDASATTNYIDRLDEMADFLNRKLSGNLEYLERIRQSIPDDHLQYRTVDYLAPYVVYAFDPTSPQGRLIVRMGFHDGNNMERPTLWFSKGKDAAWFAHFMHQLETAWSAASAIEEAGGWTANWRSNADN
jgi:hypothetical protein